MIRARPKSPLLATLAALAALAALPSAPAAAGIAPGGRDALASSAPAAAVATNAAVPQRRFAAPDLASGSPATGVGGLGEVTLALAVVLAAIFGLAWVVRRVRGVAGSASVLGVLAEVRLGPKERALLVKVGTQQLLVGVAPGQVATLHVLPQPVEIVRTGTTAQGDKPTFRSLLTRSLGK
jgi:flagellar protein FliO/FliZ